MSSTQKADSGSGCFSGILRRLLCQGSPQTHPSDQITELKEPDFDEPKKETKPEPEIHASGVPGIVARLMGLDSLPEAKGIPNGKAPKTVTRSRSVNFMDYLLQNDLAQSHQHRRVRTSVSFREVPTSFRQQNPELLVLYLDEVDEKKRRNSSTLKKSDGDIRDVNQKKEERRTNKKGNMRVKLDVKKKEISQGNSSKKFSKFRDEPRRVSVKNHSKISDFDGANDLGVVLAGKTYARRENGTTLKRRSPLKPIHHQQEVLANPKVSKNKSRLASVEEVEPVECSSENSSPVSVLDVNDYSIYNDIPSTSAGEDSRGMDLNSKTKSSMKTMNSNNPYTHSAPTVSNNISVKKKDYECVDDQITDYFKEMAAQLCKITEEAIMQSNWIPEKMLNFEDYEEICMQFGQEILDVLLQQAVDELVGFDMDILLCNV